MKLILLVVRTESSPCEETRLMTTTNSLSLAAAKQSKEKWNPLLGIPASCSLSLHIKTLQT